MKKNNSKFELNLIDPDDLVDKRESAEGIVYKLELENIGRTIARLQYHLSVWQYRELHKQLRFKEFLGFKLTDVEQEQLLQLEENMCKLLENSNVCICDLHAPTNKPVGGI